MSKKCHRSRLRSRSRSKYGRRSKPGRSPSPCPHIHARSSNEKQDSLLAILKTLQEVQQDLKHTNDHVTSMEKHWHQDVPVFPPNSSMETDSLSVMVHSDKDLVSDCEGLDTALKPPVRANEPPIRANEPPTEVSEPQSGANKPPVKAVKRPNAPNVPANDGVLYDPDSQHPSWEPKADFTVFLEKHFLRKLSYDQVTFQVLHQSKQTLQGASQKTWVRPPDLLSAHAQGHHDLLIRRSPLLAPTLSKTTVQKTGVPVVPPNRRQKNRLIHTQQEGNNLRPRHPQCCSRLQNSVALQTSSIYHTSYKSQPSKCRPHRFRGGEPPHQGGDCRTPPPPPIREHSFSRLFLVPKKGGTFRPVIDLSFLNKFMENSHFQMESIHCLKSLLLKGDYMTTLDLKDAYLSVPGHKDSQKFLQLLWRNKCYAFQGLRFWLKYRTKDLHQTFKTCSSIPSQTGCSYDPLSG